MPASKARKLVLSAWIVVLTTSCSDIESDGRFYSSACASLLSNGEVADCDVDEERSENLRETLDRSLALDQKFPGPEIPDFGSHEKVVSVEGIGAITLESGTKLQLAGLQCNSEINSYIESMFLSEDPSEILYVATGLEEAGVAFAYVWEYSETIDPEFGPFISYSSVNELGISNHWCTPIQQEQHLYHQRFINVAQLFELM